MKPGSIVYWSKKFKAKRESKVQEILKKIYAEFVAHVDDSSWRVNGKPSYDVESYLKDNPTIKKRRKYDEDHIKLMRRLDDIVEEYFVFHKDFRIPFTSDSTELHI